VRKRRGALVLAFVAALVAGQVGAAEPEMGGRHLAMMLGALIETGRRFEASVHAYGPSSGSGNYVISLTC